MFKILVKHIFFILEISFPVAEKLIFVFSCIDYCSALLAVDSNVTLNKLQVVQNSAARILTRTRIRDHITLESLHWLPVRFRVDLKILMLTYKALHGLAPLCPNSLNPNPWPSLIWNWSFNCSANLFKTDGRWGFLFTSS